MPSGEGASGRLVPVVDRERCEGRAVCEAVCPHDVFRVGRMTDADFAALSWWGRLRSLLHGRQSAYTPNAAACAACGECVKSCPERAIRLVEAS